MADILATQLNSPDISGWGSPDGPLFRSGRYAEAEIMMGNSTAGQSYGNTGCAECTGSFCDGWIIQCA